MRKIFCFFLLVIVLFPAVIQATYNHVLFYNKTDKYILLNAFPIDNADNIKGVLFSNNDWHFRRYGDSKEIFEFFQALGFENKIARMKLKSIFQKSPPDNDRFIARNWSNFFNWLSDMRIEEISGTTILIKESREFSNEQLDSMYKELNYFPSIDKYKSDLPDLLINVSGSNNNILDLGKVEIGQEKKVQVILSAVNLNSSLLTIEPINLTELDHTLNFNKIDESIFLSEYKSDTLTFVFSPRQKNLSSKIWHGDTLTYKIVFKGDYLSQPCYLNIKGIRVASQAFSFPWINVVIFIFVLALVSYFLISKNNFILLWLASLKQKKFKKVTKQSEQPQTPKTVYSPEEPDKQKKEIKKNESLQVIENKTKNFDFDKHAKFLHSVKKLYAEYADSDQYKELVQQLFGPAIQEEESYHKKVIANLNEAQREKDFQIESLQWYKETFDDLKKNFKVADLDDFEARAFLTQKANLLEHKKVYDLINKFCYDPVLKKPDPFINTDEALDKNINVLQKNRDKLIELKAQLKKLDSIKQEIKEFITDVHAGYINNIRESVWDKRETSDEKDNVVDFEDYLRIKNLFDDVTENFSTFLNEIHEQLQYFQDVNISHYWITIVNRILFGYCGLSGINGCLERYESLSNPNVLFKFLDMDNEKDFRKLSKEKIESRFRDNFILKSFCWTALQTLLRLSTYLKRKEFRSGDDIDLFRKVKFLSDDLEQLLSDFGVYPHQFNLITTSASNKNIVSQITDNAIPYLEHIKPIRSKLKYLVLTKELQEGFIYDVDFVGFDIKLNGSIEQEKSRTSRVKIFHQKEIFFD